VNSTQSSKSVKGSQPSVSTLVPSSGPQWYAVHTRAKHERKVATQLSNKGITAFVPTVKERHRWSDRQKIVEVPLFVCYVFVNVLAWQQVHHELLRTSGFLRWVGVNGEPAAIPDAQIEAVRSTLTSGLSFSPYPFLKLGQKVRVRGGSLEGVEGILVRRTGDARLILSLDLIQQSLALTIEGYDVEPIAAQPPLRRDTRQS
jgi:transcription antitermination factor NusG